MNIDMSRSTDSPSRGLTRVSDQQHLEQLIRARHSCILLTTYEEDHAREIICQAAINAGMNLRFWSSSRGIRDGMLADNPAIPDTEPAAAALFCMLRQPVSGIVVLVDLANQLEDARVTRMLRDLIECQRALGGCVVMLDHSDELPDVIAHQATRMRLALPDEAELARLVRATVQRENQARHVEAKLSRGALNMMIRNLRGLTRRQAEQLIVDAISHDSRLTDSDINTILAGKRRMLHKDGLLEFVESLATLDEIAGLERLKTWLRQREPALSDEAVAYGLQPPRGVLMLGVPGAGKSLCAKAVAAAWGRPLLRLDPSVLYDRYIGESERRLREALYQAEAMSPIILWVDEIEKGFASAASHSVDGGLSQRMFGTLLTWMQEHAAPVFLIATANNIEALPAELLRKGRFDEIFFIDLPGRPARRAVFDIHLTKRKLEAKNFDLDALADASESFTGSDIEQAIISSMHVAFAARSEPRTEDILQALHASPPLAVTMAEYVRDLREWARGRCVPAD